MNLNSLNIVDSVGTWEFLASKRLTRQGMLATQIFFCIKNKPVMSCDLRSNKGMWINESVKEREKEYDSNI